MSKFKPSGKFIANIQYNKSLYNSKLNNKPFTVVIQEKNQIYIDITSDPSLLEKIIDELTQGLIITKYKNKVISETDYFGPKIYKELDFTEITTKKELENLLKKSFLLKINSIDILNAGDYGYN